MEDARKSPGAAFFLSVIPGAGHLYAGKVGPGLGWLLSVVLAYRVAPAFGLLLHFTCAVTAATAAAGANRKEASDMASRRESAEDVARMLDTAASLRRAAGPPAPTADPPPRIMRGAFPVPPGVLLRAVAEGMRGAGLSVLGVDEHHLRVRGAADHGGGRRTTVAAQVEGTPAGSRVRLLIDRPEGSAVGPEADDEALRDILERADRALREGPTGMAALAPAGSGMPAVLGGGEALTEDHFLEQLREAWEAYDQGWLPEEEWRDRKASLLRSVVLRKGTRKRDFMAACRPLSEAGVLAPEDLGALESSLLE